MSVAYELKQKRAAAGFSVPQLAHTRAAVIGQLLQLAAKRSTSATLAEASLRS